MPPIGIIPPTPPVESIPLSHGPTSLEPGDEPWKVLAVGRVPGLLHARGAGPATVPVVIVCPVAAATSRTWRNFCVRGYVRSLPGTRTP